MKRYETVVIAAPSVAEEDLEPLNSGLEKVITDGGGTILKTEPWGKRRLAYKIGNHEEGSYTLFFYEGTSEIVRELERRIRIDDKLIRYLTIYVDWEKKVAEAEAARAARARGRAARDAARAAQTGAPPASPDPTPPPAQTTAPPTPPAEEPPAGGATS